MHASGEGMSRAVRNSELVAYEDPWFVVEQCRDCPLPGYLIVRSKVPAVDWASVSGDALARLGPLLQRVVCSIHGQLRPLRVYVAQFGEAGSDFHFHVFPRTAALTREFLLACPDHNLVVHGPVLLDWARERYREEAPTEQTFQVLRAVRQELKKPDHAAQQAAAPDGRR